MMAPKLRWLLPFLLIPVLTSGQSGGTAQFPRKVEVKPPTADRTATAFVVWGGISSGASGTTAVINADGTFNIPSITPLAATVTLAPTGSVVFGTDFSIMTDNSASNPGWPWLRSDGNYLSINTDASNLYLLDLSGTQTTIYTRSGTTLVADSNFQAPSTSVFTFSIDAASGKEAWVVWNERDVGVRWSLGTKAGDGTLWLKYGWYNGTDSFAWGITNSAARFTILSSTFGTGNVEGSQFVLGRNTSGNGAAGCLAFVAKDGTAYYVWADVTGALRIHTSCPQEDGDPSDTAGVKVGTQS